MFDRVLREGLVMGYTDTQLKRLFYEGGFRNTEVEYREDNEFPGLMSWLECKAYVRKN